MVWENESVAGPGERESLRRLLAAGRRAIAAYRTAEAAASDHRVKAALWCLRRDHERHMEELASVLGERAARVELADGSAESDPVARAVRRGVAGGAGLLEAVQRSESELEREYRAQLEAGYGEPLYAMLSRHLREEQAHLEWLDESRWWRRIRGVDGGESSGEGGRRV